MKQAKLVYLSRIVIVSMLFINPLNAANLKIYDRFSAEDLPWGFVNLKSASGKITFMRVSEPEDSWGPKDRQIKGEVIVKIDSQGTRKAYGFQLRKDDRTAAYSAMFELLKDALKNDWTVTIEYLMPELSQDFPNEPGWNVGYIVRVAVEKQQHPRVGPAVIE